MVCHGFQICLGSRMVFAKTVTSQLTFIVRVSFSCVGHSRKSLVRSGSRINAFRQ